MIYSSRIFAVLQLQFWSFFQLKKLKNQPCKRKTISIKILQPPYLPHARSSQPPQTLQPPFSDSCIKLQLEICMKTAWFHAFSWQLFGRIFRQLAGNFWTRKLRRFVWQILGHNLWRFLQHFSL